MKAILNVEPLSSRECRLLLAFLKHLYGHCSHRVDCYRRTNLEPISILTLPQEIQLTIYAYVLGHATICIHRWRCPLESKHTDANLQAADPGIAAKHPPDCQLCTAPYRQRLLLGHVVTSGADPFIDQLVPPITKASLEPSTIPCNHRSKSHQKLSLALLRTCRHIYNSALALAYRTSTFCLGPGSNTHVAKAFLHSLPARQSALIRTISLQLFICPFAGPPFYAALSHMPSEAFSLDRVYSDNTFVLDYWTIFFGRLALLTGLQKLIVEVKWKPHLLMWLPERKRNFVPTMQGFRHCLEGIKGLDVPELQIKFWQWRETDMEVSKWERKTALEEGIRARLLGLDEEEDREGR